MALPCSAQSVPVPSSQTADVLTLDLLQVACQALDQLSADGMRSAAFRCHVAKDELGGTG